MSSSFVTRHQIGHAVCVIVAVAVVGGLAGGVRAGGPAGIGVDEEDAPAGFPRFEFAGGEDYAAVLSEFLWYHFAHRLHNAKTLFNKEYLTIADTWVNGAIDTHHNLTIQEVHRKNLLGMRLDDEGYVHTHQHFSHAHEHGWPFPLWTQSGSSPDDVAGKTAGWHFSENGDRRWPLWQFLAAWGKSEYSGDAATRGWELENCRSLGIVDGRWRIESTGSPVALLTPTGMSIEAFQAPFLQLRWRCAEGQTDRALPYIEWLREGDTAFGPDRRVYIHTRDEEHVNVTGTNHSMIRMHDHPLWCGRITRMRICLSPSTPRDWYEIDSFFTAYDTRHAINNPVFVFAHWNFFRWTGDLDFLLRSVDRMRLATRYMMTVMGGLENDCILNTWPGHDGLPGYVVNRDGSRTIHGGHGIGNNYYDLLPFGWKDCYSTMQYYAVLNTMADVEEAVRAHPGWGMPGGALSLDPDRLRAHAAKVKEVGNDLFWSESKGRFIACIDKNGTPRDYGYTWLNLESIWYGFATPEHARAIMDWITGNRIIEGETSTGEDIYRFRFGPRASTVRNVEWYGQAWHLPDAIPWGGQIQDGGAVLGFAFYDLWARLNLLGADDAWQRLTEILDWEMEVRSEGGYRAYYADGRHGTTLQGGGTAGGIGIDFEFYESSLLPSIVVYGFIGLDPRADALAIAPRLPSTCPSMTVTNILFRGCRLDITAGNDQLRIKLADRPVDGIRVVLPAGWQHQQSGDSAGVFTLVQPGVYELSRMSQ